MQSPPPSRERFMVFGSTYLFLLAAPEPVGDARCAVTGLECLIPPN